MRVNRTGSWFFMGREKPTLQYWGDKGVGKRDWCKCKASIGWELAWFLDRMCWTQEENRLSLYDDYTRETKSRQINVTPLHYTTAPVSLRSANWETMKESLRGFFLCHSCGLSATRTSFARFCSCKLPAVTSFKDIVSLCQAVNYNSNSRVSTKTPIRYAFVSRWLFLLRELGGDGVRSRVHSISPRLCYSSIWNGIISPFSSLRHKMISIRT